MGEKEPKKPFFKLDLGGTHQICTPDNTSLFLHEIPDYSKFDHIFVAKRFEEQENATYGDWYFRKMLGTRFDAVAAYMIKHTFEVNYSPYPSDGDVEQYNKMFKTDEKIDREHPQEISLRAERKIRFLGYILLKDLLVPDDFNTSGDLYI